MDIQKKIYRIYKNRLLKFYHQSLHLYFKLIIGNRKFCIISNDCWGAEIYKISNRPFNTPFIGLMLMSPCYLKLLEKPKYYLGLPLIFKRNSKYPLMQKLNAGVSFPLAVLGDSEIEVHFLHYKSEVIAKEKWERRIKRIDWNNLFIKYDCGKDYADKKSVEKFIAFPYSNKLVFGKENFGHKRVWVLENYNTDAVVQFQNCFLSFNPFGWLKGKAGFTNNFQKLICRVAYKYV